MKLIMLILVIICVTINCVSAEQFANCTQITSDCNEAYLKHYEQFGNLFCCSTIKFANCVASHNQNCSELLPAISSEDFCSNRTSDDTNTSGLKCFLLDQWIWLMVLIVVTLLMVIVLIAFCFAKCIIVCMILPKDKISDAILNQDDRRFSFGFN